MPACFKSSPLALIMGLACACGSSDETEPICDQPNIFEKSPGDTLEGPGWHRLYVQGASDTANSDGRYAMNEHRNRINTGDHFLLNQGSLVEWLYPIADNLAGDIFLHLARVDEPNLLARYELVLKRGQDEMELFSIDDTSAGEMGYVPFERCFRAKSDVTVADGDELMLRVTNLSGGELGIVVQSPDYWTWLDIEVE